jgi:hypothetical protein
MKNPTTALKILLFGTVVVAISVFFWPFVLPGLILWLIFRGRYDHWIAPLAALTIVLIWRLSLNSWPIHIGDGSTNVWYVELLMGVVSWALASIFVGAGYLTPKFFLEGLYPESKRS